MTKKKFYFTYGSEGQPYSGGWTEVTAPDYITAVAVFGAVHRTGDDEPVNCCAIYCEEEFAKTKMPVNGNLGAFCHERIVLDIEYP